MNCVSLSWIISGIVLNYYMYWITKVSLDNFWSSLYFATLIHARWFTETILISRKNKRWADFYSWRGKMILTYWIDCIKNMFSFLNFCTCVLSALVLETMISHLIQLCKTEGVHYVLWHSLTLTRYGYFWWIEAFGTVPLWWISKRKKSCWPLWASAVCRKHSSQAVSTAKQCHWFIL